MKKKQRDLYRNFFATKTCIEDYDGETAMLVVETAKDHHGRGQHLVKQSAENSHLPVVTKNFTILDNRYRVNTHEKKIAKELMIKI